jgi:biotin-[acetyl-CoA-carboxylase] ligase BirA-like protein
MASWQAFYFDSVDSTNNVAKRLIRDDQIYGCAYIVAREQTAGRGQRGRLWLSPRDAGIYVTIVDFPNALPTPFTNLFTLGAGIACVETLRQCAGVDVRLKPINDLYVDGHKLGGILTEAILEQCNLRALITGVGINLRRAERILSSDHDHLQPICLEELMPHEPFVAMDVQDFILTLVKRIRHWNGLVCGRDNGMLDNEWRKYALSDHVKKPEGTGIGAHCIE